MNRRVPAKVQVGRFVRLVLPAVLVLLGGALLGVVALTYRLTHPARTTESVQPAHYLLPSKVVAWSSEDGVEMSGWWIPGLRDSAGIVMAPGHGVGQADVLSLAAMLHQDGFNILLYSQRGCGVAAVAGSTLGLRETGDMLVAIDQLRSRPEVDPERLGIWGMDSGARAGLAAAARESSVRAVVADSPFDRVEDFVAVRMREDWGANSRLLDMGIGVILRWYAIGSGATLDERIPVQELSDRSILFILGENRRDMSRLASALFDRIDPQKEMVTLPVARTRVMNHEEQAAYDRQVANFFRLNLGVMVEPAR